MYGAWLANAGNRLVGGCLARFMEYMEKGMRAQERED